MTAHSDLLARHISAGGRGVARVVSCRCDHAVFVCGLLLAACGRAADSSVATNANVSASAAVGVVQMVNEADLKERETSNLDFDTVKGPLRISVPETSADLNDGWKPVIVGGIEISRAETWMCEDDPASGPLVVSGNAKFMTVTKPSTAEGDPTGITKGTAASKPVATEVAAAREKARDLAKDAGKPAETAKAAAKETTRKPAKEVAKTATPSVDVPKKGPEASSNKMVKEPAREVVAAAREPVSEPPKALAREMPKEPAVRPTPEPPREAAKEFHREPVKEPVAEVAKGGPTEAAKWALHEVDKAPARETPKEVVREVAPETKRETAKAAPQEAAREMTGAPSKEIAKRDEKRRGQGEERGLGPLGFLIDALNGLNPGARESRQAKPENAALSEPAVAARPSSPLGTEKAVAGANAAAGGGEVKTGMAGKEAPVQPVPLEVTQGKVPEKSKRSTPALVPPKPEVNLREPAAGMAAAVTEHPLPAERMSSAVKDEPAASHRARPPVLIGALSEPSKEDEPKAGGPAAPPAEGRLVAKGEPPPVAVQLPERPLTGKEILMLTPSNGRSENAQKPSVPVEPSARIEVAALNAPAAGVSPKPEPPPMVKIEVPVAAKPVARDPDANRPVNAVVGALNNPSMLAAAAARSLAMTVAGNIEVALPPGTERRVENARPPIWVSGVPNVVPQTGGIRVGTLAGTGARAPAVVQGGNITVREASGKGPVAGVAVENFPVVVVAAGASSPVSAKPWIPVQIGSPGGGSENRGGKTVAPSVNSPTKGTGGILVGSVAPSAMVTVKEPSRTGAPAAYSGNTISVAMAGEAVGHAAVNLPRNKLFNPAGTLLHVGNQGDEEARAARGDGRTTASNVSAASRPLGGKVGALTLAEDSMLNLKPAGKRDALSYAPAKRSPAADNENMSTRLLDAEMQLLEISEASALSGGGPAASLAAEDKSRRDASSPSSGPRTEALLGGLMLLGLLVQQWQRFREENRVRR